MNVGPCGVPSSIRRDDDVEEGTVRPPTVGTALPCGTKRLSAVPPSSGMATTIGRPGRGPCTFLEADRGKEPLVIPAPLKV